VTRSPTLQINLYAKTRDVPTGKERGDIAGGMISDAPGSIMYQIIACVPDKGSSKGSSPDSDELRRSSRNESFASGLVGVDQARRL
jgi:hypothetical protein